MSYFKTILLHELKVNGQVVDDNDDFNMEDDADENTATEAPADTATDAAENETDNQQENQNNDNADEEDDFTIDDEDEEDLDNTEEDNTETEDQEEDNTETEDQENDNTGNDEDDDFTMDDEGGDDSAEGGEEGNDQPTENTENKEKDLPDNPTDAIDDDDKRAAEEAIYDSLTDDQKRIRVLQLKIDYKNLYETIMNTLESINDIPKNMDNLDTIKRLTMFLTKAKMILIDYVSNNFDTNSYLENYTTYIKYLAVFRTVSKVIEELNESK